MILPYLKTPLDILASISYVNKKEQKTFPSKSPVISSITNYHGNVYTLCKKYVSYGKLKNIENVKETFQEKTPEFSFHITL